MKETTKTTETTGATGTSALQQRLSDALAEPVDASNVINGITDVNSVNDADTNDTPAGNSVTFSSSDFNDTTQSVEYTDDGNDAVISVDPKETYDPILNAAAGAGAPMQGILSGVSDSNTTVTVTFEDRTTFIDSLLENTRYTRNFSLFGGAVTGKIRCRSTAESEAIANWVNWCISTKRFANGLEYAVGIRNAVLAAQLAELNGVTYPELASPLNPEETENGVTEPGWVKTLEVWNKKPEAIVTQLFSEIVEFERRYWTMISKSRDLNFWHPAE